MTQRINEILPREIQSGVEQTLTKFSEIIDEFVNFGTHVFKRVIEQSKGSDEQMPLMIFFRDMLEKADSIPDPQIGSGFFTCRGSQVCSQLFQLMRPVIFSFIISGRRNNTKIPSKIIIDS